MPKLQNRHQRLWFLERYGPSRSWRSDSVGVARRDFKTKTDVSDEITSINDTVSSKPRFAVEIKDALDSKVIGQEAAKRALSLLISLFLNWDYESGILQPPPNGVIVGPTGSGKTFSIKVASSALSIPFHVFDATSLVPEGAKSGSSVSMLREQIRDTEFSKDIDPTLSGKVIVFIDEFDKLATTDSDSNSYWKRDTQRGLLKFIETQYTDASKSEPKALFIMGGAFTNIEKLRRNRRPETQRDLHRVGRENEIVPEDMTNFGLIPELTSRIPAIIRYEALDRGVLLEILKHPESSPLAMWRSHFHKLGKELSFSDEFLAEVAKRAALLQIGARGLQQILFDPLARFTFFEENRPETNAHVDLATLNQGEV